MTLRKSVILISQMLGIWIFVDTPDIDTWDEEKLVLFSLRILSFPFFILFLWDYYKFVSNHPFCRQAFLFFPLWTSIFCSECVCVGGEFHFVSFSLSLFLNPPPTRMKCSISSFSFSIFSLFLWHSIFFLFSFTLKFLSPLCVLIFSCAA